jgi:hypothetical protein
VPRGQSLKIFCDFTAPNGSNIATAAVITDFIARLFVLMKII